MHEITLENYRCFRERQTARMAPLTLLVGENSTGKTSFLAMIQVLLDMTYKANTPNFKKSPFDLGSFDEIAHYSGGRDGRANTFKASFSAGDSGYMNRKLHSEHKSSRFEVEFGRGLGTVPVPKYWSLSNNKDVYIKSHLNEIDKSSFPRLCFGISKSSWQTIADAEDLLSFLFERDSILFPHLEFIFNLLRTSTDDLSNEPMIEANNGTKNPTSEHWEQILELAQIFKSSEFSEGKFLASAPVRSQPHRTYHPAHLTPNPEGDNIPMYMANLFYKDEKEWNKLQKSLTKFGRESGLFDEISIKSLGKKESEPFQLQIRKFGTTAKGPSRNLMDVGYGVSQVLPIITELSRSRTYSMYLLQQPELHLHPSAQAALGSLFCHFADRRRTLVVETHSDYILDRVRMEVRDGNSKLKPEDVSILFFERKNLGAQIHSLSIDNQGNILDAPDSYRKFFMEETRRSLGL